MASPRFEMVSIQAGGTVLIEAVLTSNHIVSGLEFKIQATVDGTPTTDAVLNGITNNLGDEFDIYFGTDEDSVTTFVIVNLEGAEIPADETSLMQLEYNIDENATEGELITLQVTESVLVDSNRVVIDHVVTEGSINVEVGSPGDVNRDGKINIVDIVTVIHMIVGRIPMPEVGSFDHFLANANGVNLVDVTDVVFMIDKVINDGGQPKVVVRRPMSPVTVRIEPFERLNSGEWVIPVSMQSDGVIAAAQTEIIFDPAKLQLGTPRLTGRTADMAIVSHVEDGTLRLVMYNLSNSGIPAGDGAAVLIPFNKRGDDGVSSGIKLSHVILVDQLAQSIPVTISDAEKVSSLPLEFALNYSYPNPFNPSTQIAYEVPNQTHIVLAVYNLLGQEIIRLVDTVQAPGRYTTVWSGTNAQGRLLGNKGTRSVIGFYTTPLLCKTYDDFLFPKSSYILCRIFGKGNLTETRFL